MSACVCFLVFCLPALRKLSGIVEAEQKVLAVLDDDLPADQERPEFHRVKISWTTENGRPLAQSTGKQQSSRLLSLCEMDGLVLVQPSQSKRAGDVVEVLLL